MEPAAESSTGTAPAPSAASATARRAGGTKSRRALVAVVVALVVGALVWSAAWFYLPPIVASQARQASERMLGRQLSLGRVTFRPWTLELTIDELAVAGASASAPPLLAVRHIHADLAITSLLRLAPIVDRLEVDAPMLRLERTAADRTDVDDVLQHLAALPPSAEPARFAIHNIVVRDGGADVVDRPLATTHRLRDLALSVPFVSSLPSEREIQVEPHLAFSLDGSRFDSAGSATPFAERGNGELRVRLDGFSIAPYLGYLPRGLPAKLRAATLDADVTVAFEQRPKLSLKIAGAVGARGVEIVDARSQALLEVGSAKVQIDELRPLERVARLKSIDIDAPHVVAARSAAGRINLLLGGDAAADGARVPAAGAAAPRAATSAPANSAPTASPWRWSLAALSLGAGRLDWTDATTAPPAALALTDATLHAESIGWPMAAPVAFRGSAGLGAGDARGKLSFSGQGDTRGAKVHLALAALPLAPLRSYLRAVLAPTLAGEASAELDLDWRADDGRLLVAASRLALAGVSLGEARSPDAAVERIEASDARIDTAARSASVGRLALRAPRVRVAREAGGHWNFERWGNTPDEADPQRRRAVAAPASASAKAASESWSVALGELAIERGRIALADRASAVPVAIELVDVAAELRGFALDADKPAPFHVGARVRLAGSASGKEVGSGTPGTIDVRGQLAGFADGVPRSAHAAVLLKDLPLHVLDPYFDEFVNLEVQKAQTSFRGDVRWARSAAGQTVALRGDAAVDDFRASNASTERDRPTRGLAMVRDGRPGRDLLNWKTLSLRGLSFAMAPGQPMRVGVAETALGDFFARVVLDESGHLNLEDVTRPARADAAADAAQPAHAAGPAAGASAAAASRSAAAPLLEFGPIAVVGGRISYNDRFVKPNFSANLTELSGRLGAFSSASAASSSAGGVQLADLELRGRVGGTATLEVAGKVNPLADPLALDVHAKVRDLELPPLSPYAIKYAGYGIERGKMSVDLAYVVQPNGELTATNRIVLNQLAFGDKVEGSSASLPVKLATALLADRNGVIDLDLPISGSINDPKFSLGSVIWKVITNLVVKAVTSPFALLSSAMSGGASESSRIDFAPGSAALDAAAREKLDKIAQALVDRPGLTLTISGESRLDRERDAWKEERLRQIVRSEKRRQAIAGGASASAEVTVSAEEAPALLKEVYRRADIVKPRNVLGIAKDLPPAEMRALLLSNMTLGDDAMQQLAVRRGIAVRDYLARHAVPTERLFLGAPKAASDAADWTPRVDLKLAAG